MRVRVHRPAPRDPRQVLAELFRGHMNQLAWMRHLAPHVGHSFTLHGEVRRVAQVRYEDVLWAVRDRATGAEDFESMGHKQAAQWIAQAIATTEIRTKPLRGETGPKVDWGVDTRQWWEDQWKARGGS